METPLTSELGPKGPNSLVNYRSVFGDWVKNRRPVLQLVYKKRRCFDTAAEALVTIRSIRNHSSIEAATCRASQ